MNLAVMQPYFFPYLGYFQLIHAVDRFVLYPHVAYIKKGWMNRNRILIKWEKPVYIHVPVSHAGIGSSISQARIDNRHPGWRKRLLDTLRHNYASSVFFQETWPVVQEGISADLATLYDFNANIVCRIATHLGLQSQIIRDIQRHCDIEQALAAETPSDHADGIDPAQEPPERRTRRVVALCNKEGAECYINPIGGVDLYHKDVFGRHGIDLRFVSAPDVPYRQFSKAFHPKLSIIDVLMHNGREGTRRLLEQYTLI